MTPYEIEQRRLQRQMKVFSAATAIRDKLGGSVGPVEERLEHVRVAALGAVAEARAAMRALVANKFISERQAQDFLDWGYDDLLRQIDAGLAAKVFEAGHG